MTVAVDRIAEDAVLAELERLHEGGHSFSVVSEELGERDFGGGDVRVVVDPVDGSANAARGLPYYSLSIAVASGPRMGDVELAYVHDFATGEEWTATRGGGAWLDGKPLDDQGPKLPIEILALEATLARLVADYSPALAELTVRLRIMGSCALSLCHFAAGRVDAVCTVRPVRCVDIAAAQLLALERGLHVQLTDGRPLADAPLTLAYRSRVVAAAEPELCERLAQALVSVVRDEVQSS